MGYKKFSLMIRDTGRIQVAITPKGGELDTRLLLYTNGMSYMGSSTSPLDLTLSDLKGRSQGH